MSITFIIKGKQFKLQEKFFSYGKTFDQNQDLFEVYKNPNKDDVIECSKNRDTVLRGFIHSRDLYFWDGTIALHTDGFRIVKEGEGVEKYDIVPLYLYPKNNVIIKIMVSSSIGNTKYKPYIKFGKITDHRLIDFILNNSHIKSISSPNVKISKELGW